jgi:hypothetical protein
MVRDLGAEIAGAQDGSRIIADRGQVGEHRQYKTEFSNRLRPDWRSIPETCHYHHRDESAEQRDPDAPIPSENHRLIAFRSIA